MGGLARRAARAPDGDGRGVPGRLLPGLVALPRALAPAAGPGQRGGCRALPRPAERTWPNGRRSWPARRPRRRGLRELARRKDEFLGTVSHELRTPLTVICGYAELLLARDTGLDGEAKRMMGSLLTSATQLSLMVDDVLDFARIERGVLTAAAGGRPGAGGAPDPGHAARAAGRGDGAGRAPGALPAYADPERCGQLVNHLVANALSTPRGPRSRAPVHPARHPVPEWARLEVQDGGPGMRRRGGERSGSPSTAGRAPRWRKARTGAGIGLALVKAIAEAQGGQAGAWSVAGQGSRFWVDLPVAPSPERESNATHGGDKSEPRRSRTRRGVVEVRAKSAAPPRWRWPWPALTGRPAPRGPLATALTTGDLPEGLRRRGWRPGPGWPGPGTSGATPIPLLLVITQRGTSSRCST